MRLETTKVSISNKSINKYQYNILLSFYKFRIVTIPELHNYLNNKSESSVRKNLIRLEQMGYIAKKYDNSYRLRHQSAYYYLTNLGINAIKQDKLVKKNILHRLYKKDLTEAGMQHFVDIFKVYNAIERQYASHNVDIYTKQELDQTELSPDLLIKFASNERVGDEQYFIFLAHDMYPFLIKKLISKYIIRSEEEELPALLVAAKDKTTIRSLVRYTKQLLLSLCIDESEVAIGLGVFEEIIKASDETANEWIFIGP